MSRVLALVLAVALVLGGCSSGKVGHEAEAPAPHGGGIAVAGCPDVAAQIGDSGAGAVGKGPGAVVLAHMRGGNRCDWWPFAQRLVDTGIRVLALDFPSDPEHHSLDADVAGAAALLRQQGATKVVLVGASMGATAALAAATQLDPGADGVVDISGPATFGTVDARAHAADVRTPVLFVASNDDHHYVDDVRALRAAVAGSDLLVVPGAAHGTALLSQQSVADRIVRFVTDRTR